ncbi:hypothetical protein CNEO4_1170076 [Clostridium neonatale]|nr:hypothetical protein CNEO4_1170076 [Clostridium neonatale]CAI4142733.1 hypothetical protein CNEO4_990078 [Clostridium neonatale]
MRLAFSQARSENPECAEKNRRLKDFLEFKLVYYIGLYNSRFAIFFIVMNYYFRRSYYK